MNTKNLVLMSLLVSIGAALYLVIPGFNGGMCKWNLHLDGPIEDKGYGAIGLFVL
jgi:hypothetical protein